MLHSAYEVLLSVSILSVFLSPLFFIVTYKHYQSKRIRESGVDCDELERLEKMQNDKNAFDKFYSTQGYTSSDLTKAEEIAPSYSPTHTTDEAWVPEHLSKSFNQVFAKRWLALVLDCMVSFSVLIIAELILGNQLYQKTIYVWVLLMIAYLPTLEGLTGRTIGKLICRIKVVDAYGNKPGIKKSMIRGFFRFIEFNPLLVAIPAALSIYKSKTDQRIGDRVAKTYVIGSDVISK